MEKGGLERMAKIKEDNNLKTRLKRLGFFLQKTFTERAMM